MKNKEYHGYGYQFHTPEKCVTFLPIKAEVIAFVGTEEEIKACFDLLLLAEEKGLSPADCGLDEKLVDMLTGQGLN